MAHGEVKWGHEIMSASAQQVQGTGGGGAEGQIVASFPRQSVRGLPLARLQT